MFETDVAMDLAALLTDEAPPEMLGLGISGMTADSRTVTKGSLFFALKGEKTDGLIHAPMAVAQGAAAIVSDAASAPSSIDGVPVIKVANARRTLALAASRFYPRQPAVIAAVTGTSGKTSVAAFTRQIFAHLGFQAASVGTVGVVRPSGEVYGGLTTPDPITLHQTLHQLAEEGVTHLAFEASSHGLDQHRLDGVRITAAGFTNLSRDHLDYHKTMEAYRNAKLRLFTDLLGPEGNAVVMSSSESAPFSAAARRRGHSLIEIGREDEDVAGGISICEERIEGTVQHLKLSAFGNTHHVRIPLVGKFQAENALVSAALAISCGVEPEDAFAALATLQGAPGRLEVVGEVNGASVIVDYAHKPGALEAVLDSVRPFAKGRLIVIFGCGGDRDQGKRPIMGGIAVAKADKVIVTDDNPRSEDPASIRAMILANAPGAIEIGDRAGAIRTGVTMLEPGDVLVIAGKGHETGQKIGAVEYPFSDHDVAAAAIRERA